jgi:hypothetical protein
MPRLTADDLRSLVSESEKTKRGAARKLTAETARRRSLWKQFYRESINGETSTIVENLKSEDEMFFRNQGLAIDLDFCREHPRSWYVKELARIEKCIKDLKKEREALEEEILNVPENESNFDASSINEWLRHNVRIAYECDLEQWFGAEFEDYFCDEDDELAEFDSHIQEKLRLTKSEERKKSLKKLLAAIKKTRKSKIETVDIFDLKTRIEQLQRDIEDLDGEYGQIAESQGLMLGSSVKCTHEVYWGGATQKFGVTTDRNHYTIHALHWFSSKTGQLALQTLDADLKSLALMGHRSMKIHAEICTDGMALEHKGWGFKAIFPSIFDFLVFAELSGYKASHPIKAPRSIITLNW